MANTRTLTAADATYLLSITDLFPSPQSLQGFGVDDVFATDPVETAETQMGVDGRLSAGFVFNEVKQSITLQADSESADIFDQWNQAQIANRQLYIANGVITLRSLQKKATLTRGFLKTVPMLPDAKKLLQMRKFSITWQSVVLQVGA